MFYSVFGAELLAAAQLFPLADSMGFLVKTNWYDETCLIPQSFNSS